MTATVSRPDDRSLSFIGPSSTAARGRCRRSLVRLGRFVATVNVSPRRPVRSLMARAVGLLSRREHSRFELRRKLLRSLQPDEGPGDLDRVLDALEAERLLSDERFAASLVRQRSVRYGDLRLERDLHDRGVSDADADAAMTLVAGTETERAHAAWSRRFDALPASAAERARQGRYLQARGFSMDAIVQVLTGKVRADA